jgi:uncharacterized protein (DUF2267 family)
MAKLNGEHSMSTPGLESIERNVQLTHIWINDLDVRLGWHNKERSYRLLRAVLQALRDWLPINEAAHLGAQLPELLRGVYYEHWRPAITPVKRRHKADFVARVGGSFEADPLRSTVSEITSVLGFLAEKLEAGEIKKVQHSLPADVRALWPAPPQAAWSALEEGL